MKLPTRRCLRFLLLLLFLSYGEGFLFGREDALTSKKTSRDKRHSSKESNKTTTTRKPLVIPHKWARTLYSLTALNPALAVIFNDYAKMVRPFQPLRQHHHALARTYETLFFFAKLKPRVSFAIGAILRALQLTTALQYVFDPTAGVGFGLDLLSLYARSRWPATLVLGWSATAPLWRALGAAPPCGLPVPISIAMIHPKHF